MCGIAGVIDFSGVSSSDLAVLHKALQHRGPDGSGIVELPMVGLVHTRLAIIDKEGGAQPLKSPDGRWYLTYNGEIYNHRALRMELEAEWEFQSNCDAEVLLALWSRWGQEALSKLNGMFSFFIWDHHKKEGYLVRDRLGVKPLAYSHQNGVFRFASEAKALVPFISGRACEEAILEYLVAPCFSGVESSPFDGIEYLQPGTMLHICASGIRSTRWFDYVFNIAQEPPDLKEVLCDAVRSCLVSDVPIATFLSGGFDSSMITAVAARYRGAPQEAYTIVFEDQHRFDYQDSLITISDDTPHAQSLAAKVGIPHTLVEVARSQTMETLRRLSVINDALPAWEQEFAQHYLAQKTSERFSVVLVGDAADETHFGYPFLLDPFATQRPLHIMQRFSAGEYLHERFRGAMQQWNAHYIRLVQDAGHSWSTPYDRILATTYLIIKRWLPRLLHNGDIHTMHFGLEARVPFSDVQLLDCARSVSPHIAFQDQKEKYWLRSCARGLMPEEHRNRKKSALPKDQWVAHCYRSGCTALLEDEDADFLYHFFSRRKLRALCEKEQINEQERALLFRIIALANWRRAYHISM